MLKVILFYDCRHRELPIRPVQFKIFGFSIHLYSLNNSLDSIHLDSFQQYKTTQLDSIQFFTATKKAEPTLDSFGAKSAEIQLKSYSLLQWFNSILDSLVKIWS